jgi:5-methylcytosine-specific restriction endonuclease McrA
MRPVDKGGQGTYAPVVDVSSQTNLNTSLAGITITFGSTAAAPVTSVFGKANPTAKEVLDGLLLVAKAPKKKGPPPTKKPKTVSMTDQVKTIKDTLARKLSKIYGTASGPLEAQLGRFCSFCEHYYESGLAVEHIVPKAPYPLFYLAWDNFLFCCTVCNSNKLSKPPRNDALFSPAPVDEVGYFALIKDTYMWPQWYTQVYRSSMPRLEYQATDGKWYPVTYPVADGTELTTTVKETRTLRADVCAKVKTKGVSTPTWRFDRPVRVQVMPTTPRATQMVSLVALNKPSGNDKKPGGEADIRMWSRTEHWFKVLETLSDLKKVTDASAFASMWKMMMKSVQQPGLYSVWVTVLDALGPGGSWTVPGTTTPVMTKFLGEIVGQAYFPGTDTADTP